MATAIPQNRCAFTLAEIESATGGKLTGPRTSSTRGVSIDTRTIRRGELFVALEGEHGDGHAYLGQAVERGAGAVVVRSGTGFAGTSSVEVGDPLEALGDLARHHLARVRATQAIDSIAIGGSAGKTTTKELTAAVVRALFGETLSTPGNLNNRIGVPMTVFGLGARHRAMVIECGTNTRGEIDALARILTPDVAMVLNVDVEHAEGLGTLEEIAEEETALFRDARRAAVLNPDESMVAARVPPGLGVLTFGESPQADVRLVRRSLLEDGRARVSLHLAARLVESEEPAVVDARVAVLGRSAALNCAAATAGAVAMAGRRLGSNDVTKIGRALSSVPPVAGRLSTLNRNGLLIIDDSYNSNPRSLRSALEAADEIAGAARVALVIALGDMLELGAAARPAHQAAVTEVLALEPAAFVAVGPVMAAAVNAVCGRRSRTATRIITARDSHQAARLISGIVRPGQAVLVKGSRGMEMERVVEALAQPPAPAPDRQTTLDQ